MAAAAAEPVEPVAPDAPRDLPLPALAYADRGGAQKRWPPSVPV